MRDKKDEHIDPYRSVRILGQKIEPEASFAKGATLETLEIITAIKRLVETDSSKKREKLFDKLAEEAALVKDHNNPFAIGWLIDEMEKEKRPTPDQLPEFYREFLMGKNKLCPGNDRYIDFVKFVLEPTLKEYSGFLTSIPKQYDAAFIGEEIRHADVVAYANYVTAASEREAKVSWDKWPGKDRWLHSWDTYASYVHCIGDAGSGKTTLQMYNMERNAELGGWSVTNIPVADDEERHIYYVTKSSELVPIMYKFMAWVSQARKFFPAANPVLYVGIDEKKRGQTISIENINRNSFIRVRRHYGIAMFATGVQHDDIQVENQATEYIDIWKDEGGVTIRSQLPDQEPEEVRVPKITPKVKLKYASQDEATPWTWDINFDDLKEFVGLDYDIRDLSWDELYDRAMEAIPQMLGQFEEKAENEKKPTISICPRCGYEMPFNGREKKSVRCQNPHCKTLFLVDPSEENPHNFRIIDEEYEKEIQSAPKREIKKELGISICPYCSDKEPYRSTQANIQKCVKCGEIFHIDPASRENYAAYTQEMEAHIKETAEKKKKTENMHFMDRVILENPEEIKELGPEKYCKKHKMFEGHPLNPLMMRRHIKKLMEEGKLEEMIIK